MRKYFAIQFSANAASASASLLISILAVELGASPWDVGVIASCYGGAQFASHWWFGRAADVHGRRLLLKAGLAVATVAVLAHLLASSPWSLALARALFGLAAGTFPAALASLAYDSNRRLGRFQSFGSLGHAVGVLGGGLVALVFVEGVFVVASAFMAAAFLVSLTVRYPPDHRVVVPAFPRDVIERNLPAYAAIVLRHVGATAAWVVFPLYLLDLGASVWWVGVVSAANGASQFTFMRLTDRYHPRTLIVGGLLLSGAAFAAYALAPNFWWVLATQPLLAAGWAGLYMGAMRLCMYRSVERATATGLLQSSVHLAAVVGPLVGGAFAQAYGIHATIWLGAVASVLAIPLFLYELARHPDTEHDRAEARVAMLLSGK